MCYYFSKTKAACQARERFAEIDDKKQICKEIDAMQNNRETPEEKDDEQESLLITFLKQYPSHRG